ncbi:MAG: class I SAM-dependent methyltransferase [Candidatus Eisenbacteria bacterium]
MTVFGNSLRDAQRHYLHRVKPQAHVLVIGGGSGWFLERLLEETSCARVDALDISAAMLSRSEERIRRNAPDALARVRFLEGGVDLIPEGAKYDVVCTHFFLDLFRDERLRTVVPRVSAHLAEGGVWHDTDFQTAPGKMRGAYSRVLLSLMYTFFRASCSIEADRLPGFDAAFAHAGMETTESALFHGGMVRARLLRPVEGVLGRPSNA